MQAEEPSLALLLAQGALISLRKGSRRTAAMWYVFAANRLEKCGVVCLPLSSTRNILTRNIFFAEISNDVLLTSGIRAVHPPT